eukprot:scaffold2313_cov202-Prasinococcus_capsulatus_cf.AAC.2
MQPWKKHTWPSTTIEMSGESNAEQDLAPHLHAFATSTLKDFPCRKCGSMFMLVIKSPVLSSGCTRTALGQA